MRRLLPIISALCLFLPGYALSITDTELCVQKCLDGEIVPQPGTIAVFPHKVTFENSADQAGGNAAILFRTIPDGTVKAVSVNGESATLGRPYKGASVFLLSKPGEQYSRPLKFSITTSDGKFWTATSGADTTTPPVVTGDYKFKKTYSSYGIRNGRQAWRIPEAGASFGKQVKFVFSSGKTFTVKDTAWNCRDREDTCKRDSKSQNYGFVYKPGGPYPNGDGDSDRGTSHKGVYLHSPWKDTSQSVTVYFNK
jgi:hypothetical protein